MQRRNFLKAMAVSPFTAVLAGTAKNQKTDCFQCKYCRILIINGRRGFVCDAKQVGSESCGFFRRGRPKQDKPVVVSGFRDISSYAGQDMPSEFGTVEHISYYDHTEPLTEGKVPPDCIHINLGFVPDRVTVNQPLQKGSV